MWALERRIGLKDFRGLSVWQRAHSVALSVYRCTKDFPREETYGMTSQMRRCSSSVAANIAEGCGRPGNAEFARFLGIAMGRRASWSIFYYWREIWNISNPALTWPWSETLP